jgi:tRNA G37 N-methylase Trm5
MDVAFSAIIGGGTVHLYGFSAQKTGFTDLLEQAKAAAERSERKIKVVGKQKVGAYAPHQWKVRLDLKVL